VLSGKFCRCRDELSAAAMQNVCRASQGGSRASDARRSQKLRSRLKYGSVATMTALLLMLAIRDDIVRPVGRMSRAEAKPFSVDPSDYACMAHELRSREPRQRELRHSDIVDSSTVFIPTFREALAAWRQHHNLARPSDVDRQVEMRATALPHGAVGGNSSETQLGLPATTQLCCPCDAVMHQAADGAPSSSSTSSFSMTSGGVCFGCQRWFADEDTHSRHRCFAETTRRPAGRPVTFVAPVPSTPAVPAHIPAPALAKKASDEFHEDMRDCMLRERGELRYNQNMAVASLERVRESHVAMMKKVETELTERLTPGYTGADLAAIVHDTLNIYKGIETTALEDAERERTLNPRQPVERALLNAKGEKTGDVCYDFPIDETLQWWFQTDAKVWHEVQRAKAAWQAAPDGSTAADPLLFDICDGSVSSSGCV